MVVRADNKRRVILPGIKPGDIFQIEGTGEKFQLTLMKPVEPRRANPRLVKPVLRKGFLVLPLAAGELDTDALDAEIRQERELENARLLG